MPIPDYQSIMLPLLELASDNAEHRTRESLTHLATRFHLTEEQLNELSRSGQDYIFANRCGWARTYMKKAGLLFNPKWGVFKITQAGLDLLVQQPPKIDLDLLKQYPSFVEFYGGSLSSVPGARNSADEAKAEPVGEQTPDELIATAHGELRKQLESEILANVMDCSPAYFERLVVKLLTTIGYGGSLEDAGQAIGRSHDGGIDGEIKEDKLGLDTIYIQAKKWKDNVGARDIREFVGALTGRRAHKGVFITTAKFTREAISYVANIDKRVVLIDGERLAALMFEYGLGVTPTKTYVVKRIDADFFDQDGA